MLKIGFRTFKKLKRLLFIFLITLTTGLLTESFSQTSGRKKEHRNQRRASKKFGVKSAGNADDFARGGSKRRSFRKKSQSWVYRPTTTPKSQHNEQRFLFMRFRTKGKKQREGIIAKQDAERSSRRVRGNKVFHKRKF